jgi:hypothetical protein
MTHLLRWIPSLQKYVDEMPEGAPLGVVHGWRRFGAVGVHQ